MHKISPRDEPQTIVMAAPVVHEGPHADSKQADLPQRQVWQQATVQQGGKDALHGAWQHIQCQLCPASLLLN